MSRLCAILLLKPKGTIKDGRYWVFQRLPVSAGGVMDKEGALSVEVLCTGHR